MPATFEELDTTGYVWYSAGLGNPSTEMSSWIHERLKSWLGEVCNPVLDSGTIVGGSLYTDGTYNNVELVRTANQVNGRDLLCDVTISSGTVTGVTVTQKGNGFKTGDVLQFKDVAQVGGTGSGFTITVQSADASLCINRDPDEMTSTKPGWFLGQQRGSTNCTYGLAFCWKNSQTSSTSYTFNFYNWTDTSSNSGSGTWTTSNQQSEGFWDNSDAGLHKVYLGYCSEADNQFFILVDDLNYETHGIVRLERDPGGTYPSTDFLSDWVNLFCNSTYAYTKTCANGPNTDAYVGDRGYSDLKRPQDPHAFFSGEPVVTKSIIAGSMPTYIGIHKEGTSIPADTKTNGSEEWRALISNLWVKTAN